MSTDARLQGPPEPGEVTMASVWRSVAGGVISDELLEWPADVFALADVVLERSAAYRFVFSAGGVQWPPARFADWPRAVGAAGEQWSVWTEDRHGGIPGLLAEEWDVLRESAGMPLELLADGSEWRVCEALLTVHAIADEACAGLGVALDASAGRGCIYRARGRELMGRTGSLARIPTHALRVLPKVRTPPSGTSLSSLARYACVVGPNVEVHWHKLPARHRGVEPQGDHANFLLLPWPLQVRESDFRAVPGSVQRRANEPFGFFEFSPAEELDLDLLDRTLLAARDEVDRIDVVYLPENAVDEDDIDDIEAVLDQHEVALLSAGIRQRPPPPGRLPRNWVHIGVNPQHRHADREPGSRGEPWIHIRQDKHHRWSLDEGQIFQYHLGGALHPGVRWWEAMEVPRQVINFIEVGEGIVTVYLVCEDLAQSDAVAEVLRSVGPTVVTTLVLDGPQLSSRWAARYASVLADDPGSAVLTLTSYGMVQRSRPPGLDASSMIAMWKDPARGIREIPLERGAQAVLLTCCSDRANRRSSDGRWPVDNSTYFFDVAVHQVRASIGGSSPSPPARVRSAHGLAAADVTILTSWAEAVAEALAFAPERVPAVLAAARDGAPWRAELGVAEPSAQLAQRLEAMQLAVDSTATGPSDRTLEEFRASMDAAQHRARGGDTFARQVLLYALDSRAARQISNPRSQVLGTKHALRFPA